MRLQLHLHHYIWEQDKDSESTVARYTVLIYEIYNFQLKWDFSSQDNSKRFRSSLHIMLTRAETIPWVPQIIWFINIIEANLFVITSLNLVQLYSTHCVSQRWLFSFVFVFFQTYTIKSPGRQWSLLLWDLNPHSWRLGCYIVTPKF